MRYILTAAVAASALAFSAGTASAQHHGGHHPVPVGHHAPVHVAPAHLPPGHLVRPGLGVYPAPVLGPVVVTPYPVYPVYPTYPVAPRYPHVDHHDRHH